MATKEQIKESSDALTAAMGNSEAELLALGAVRTDYRAQLASAQSALTREAELEAAHEALMVEHVPTPPPSE